MKPLFLFILAVFSVFSVFAQPQNRDLRSVAADPKFFQQHLASLLQRQQHSGSPAKTTATKQRVIGESTYDVNLGNLISDSSNYSYIGYNGSVYNFNYMYYNTDWPYDLHSGSYYPYISSTVDVMCTKQNSFVSYSNVLEPLKNIYREFIGANVKISKDSNFFSTMVDGDHYEAMYNVQNQLTSLSNQHFINLSGLKNDLRHVIYFDVQNRPVKDSLFQYINNNWKAYGMITFTYDASGNLAVIDGQQDMSLPTWVHVCRFTHTYDANNKLIAAVSESYLSPGSLAYSQKYTFAYDPTNMFVTSLTRYDFNNNSWRAVFASDKHLNAQGLPDTVTDKNWNGASLAVSNKTVYSYNSFGNPVKGMNYMITGNADTLSTIHNYYYEDYNDLSVEQESSIIDVRLYPNPVKNQLVIRSKDLLGKKLSIEVMNAAGQPVLKEIANGDSETVTVSTTSFVPGIYWVRITDNSGNTIFQKSLLKQ